MSPFKQMLAGFGIGAAQVNTRLENPALAPGETLYGSVEILGGSVAQSITDVTLMIETEFKREINDSSVWQTYMLAQQPLSDAIVVQPGESMNFPFALVLPLDTPLSIKQQQVKLRTKLAVPKAVDPSDTDAIWVQPHPLMQQVFTALESIGFHLYSSECTYSRYGHRSVPFVQEFEFRPAGVYRHEVEEVEVMFNLHSHGLDVLLEIDKRARGLSGLLAEAYDLNERYTRLHLPIEGLDQQMLVRQLDGAIREALGSGRFRR